MSSDCILGAKKPHTSIDKLEAEWAEANEFSRQLEALRTAGGHGARAVSNLVGQVAVVHSVVWEKAQDIIVQLQQLKAQGPQVRAEPFRIRSSPILQ